MYVLVACSSTIARSVESISGPSAVDGELVVARLDNCGCESDCDCSRHWTGVVSGGSTGVAVVAHRPGIDRSQMRRAIGELVIRKEWPLHGRSLDALIDQQLNLMSEVLCEYPVGTELQRNGFDVIPVEMGHAA